MNTCKGYDRFCIEEEKAKEATGEDEDRSTGENQETKEVYSIPRTVSQRIGRRGGRDPSKIPSN